MTERLSDVEARIGTVHQLSAVITAMRGVAAARAREAQNRLDGIQAYAQTIATAIGQALAFLPPAMRSDAAPVGADPRGSHLIIALCAEQGFAGAFSQHVLTAAQRLQQASPHGSALLLIGDRGQMVATEWGLTVAWSAAMVAHVEQVAALANRVVEALYDRLEGGKVARVTLVHALPGATAVLEIVEKQLVPFDFGRFPLSRNAVTPLITLSPQLLLTRLVEEYVFAELCEAVTLSFAAESEARMRAMIAARSNVAAKLDSLTSQARQLRQEAITGEIIELASGATASEGGGFR